MTDHRFVADPPDLASPTMVVMLSGWIDASEVGASTMQALSAECDAVPLVEFDDDEYIDFRARRPILELRDGVNSSLRWSSIALDYGRDRGGNDVVLLAGPEPDMRWHRFAATIGALASDLGVSKMVGLGAYPYAVPHTRPTRLSSTSPSPAIRDRLPTTRNSIDLPAGMTAVLEQRLHDRQIPAFTLWAQVPHYVASMPYPAAAVALIDGLREHADVHIDGTDIRQDALSQRKRIDQLVESNEEHAAMIAQLERLYDDDDGPDVPDTSDPLHPGDLPSADELAGEIERFLRDQGKGG